MKTLASLVTALDAECVSGDTKKYSRIDTKKARPSSVASTKYKGFFPLQSAVRYEHRLGVEGRDRFRQVLH